MLEAVEGFVSELRSDGKRVRKTGREYVMLCPFHNEKKPSLYLNSESGLWHCFGCDEKGDLYKLAARFGKRIKREQSYLLGFSEEKVFEPKTEQPGDIILSYMMKIRDYSKEEAQLLIDRFGIRLVRFDRDIFAHMPIKDFEGNDIGWLMRMACDDSKDGRRYFLKKGFPVKRYFYGEWLIDKSVKRVVVVEGAFDLYRTVLAGYNCLASLGFSAPNEKLARLVKRVTELEIIDLFFDSDVKDKAVQTWLYYGELFGKKVRWFPLKSAKDPDKCSVHLIRDILQ